MKSFAGGYATSNIIDTNATTDSGEPEVAGSPDAAYPQARFNNAYSGNNGGTISACDSGLGNGSTLGITGTSSSYSIEVPYFPSGTNNTIWINTTLEITVHYSWFFLMEGNWQLENLSANNPGRYG
jgi:hypothetical protein